MKPCDRFLSLPPNFWAYVRLISQQIGYTSRRTGQIKVPTIREMAHALEQVGINSTLIVDSDGQALDLGEYLAEYFAYRAEALENQVKPKLMKVEQAREIFEEHFKKLSPGCPLPMNKQKREKKTFSYLTGLTNMIVEANIEGFPCNYDPQQLTIVARSGHLLRTFARRVDGAFPGVLNPIAVWEIKEYYYTTTFGSRVADGVYETLLDGYELKELSENEGISIKHYLIVDAYDTWWNKGRSYLCRILDMLQMGFIDEALFGYEVVERLPILSREWAETYRQQRL